MRKPVSTVFVVVWTAVVLGAVWMQIHFAEAVRYQQETEEYSEALTASYTAKVQDIDVDTLRELLGVAPEGAEAGPAADRKGTMLYLYASWCDFCRVHFPVLQSMQAGIEHAGVKLVTVSTDSMKEDLGKFVRYFQPTLQPLTPYRMPPEKRNEVVAFLNSIGISYQRGVPFTALLDAEGKVTFQGSGTVERERLLQEVDALTKNR